MNKRFWLFGGEVCYPCGGMRDFITSADSEHELQSACAKVSDDCQWWHIYDSETNKIVRKS